MLGLRTCLITFNTNLAHFGDVSADNRCYGGRVMHTAGLMSPAGKEVADEAHRGVVVGRGTDGGDLGPATFQRHMICKVAR
jgi:hypothetical protein